jgi:uridine kinase
LPFSAYLTPFCKTELRELTYPITIESKVLPVTLSDADGARIYRRSLVFLLETAFEDLFPQVELNVDHSVSSGGYYCKVVGRNPLTNKTCKTWNSACAS